MSHDTNNNDCEDEKVRPPLPKKGDPTTAFEYFNHRYFFPTQVFHNRFVEQCSNSECLRVTLDEFFIKAWQDSQRKDESLYRALICPLGKLILHVDTVFEQWAEENHFDDSNPPRMANVLYKIQDTELSHHFDLDCFTERVEGLFHWWEERDSRDKFLAPYLCLVQSSGMGKTKLLYEYKKAKEKARKDNTTQKGVAAFMFLLTTVGFHVDRQKRVYDYELDLETAIKKVDPNSNCPHRIAAKMISDRLDWELLRIAEKNPNCKKFVFLFDEAQRLLEEHYGYDAFLFRCVRVWLREQRWREGWTYEHVVVVFAGTDPRIATIPSQGEDYVEPVTNSSIYTSRASPTREKIFYDAGCKLNPPFFQTTTMGSCLDLLDENLAVNEYVRSVYYGRPLFALMAHAGILDANISKALRRMLLLEQDLVKWDSNSSTLINFLSTRIPMQQMKKEVTFELVAKGFANLVGYIEATGTHQMSYLPDPVCARLSMCMMDEDFHCELSSAANDAAAVNVQGKSKRWWTDKLEKILSSGIVRPEHDNFGELVVALYMMFCGDLLRKKINTTGAKGDREDMIQHFYTNYSVSLDEWLHLLQSGGKLPPLQPRDGLTDGSRTETDHACKVSVGFIQVCRNFVRSYGESWESLGGQGFLKLVYESGNAFFVYTGCPLLDMVVPLRVSTDNGFEFVPMFVSILCQVSCSLKEAQNICKEMKEKATEDKLERALCLLVVFGSESPEISNSSFENVDDNLTGINSVLSRLIFVPRDDDFGLTDAYEGMCRIHAEAEFLEVHPFFFAHGIKIASKAAASASSRTLADKYRSMNVEAVPR